MRVDASMRAAAASHNANSNTTSANAHNSMLIRVDMTTMLRVDYGNNRLSLLEPLVEQVRATRTCAVLFCVNAHVFATCAL
jgi:hypothetical protein